MKRRCFRAEKRKRKELVLKENIMGTMNFKRKAIWACALLAAMAVQGIPEAHGQEAQSSIYNVPMAEYPKVDAQGRAMFRLRAPEAQSVVADICGKKYPMTKDAQGVWTVTTDPLVVGFHYYFFLVDGVQVTDPGSDCFSISAMYETTHHCLQTSS